MGPPPDEPDDEGEGAMDGHWLQNGAGGSMRVDSSDSVAHRVPRAEMPSLPDGAPNDPRLSDFVTSAVIPRLLVTCRANAAPRQPTPAHVDTLARLALSRDPSAAASQIAALAESGVRLDSLLHDLIAPAARRLGEYWHADSADFVEVALAMTRLTTIVRHLGAEAARDIPHDAPLAVIATMSIERHGLGSLIVAQSFRGAGWRVREAPGADMLRLTKSVAAEPVHLVGLSVGCAAAAAGLADTIRRIRAASRNRRLIIAVGGPAYLTDPGSLKAAGADFAAADGREAVERARQLLSVASAKETND